MPSAEQRNIGGGLFLLDPLRAWGKLCYSRLRAIEQWANAPEQ